MKLVCIPKIAASALNV